MPRFGADHGAADRATRRWNQPGVDHRIEFVLAIGGRQNGRAHVNIQVDIRLIAGVDGDTAVDNVVRRQFDALTRRRGKH